MLTPHDIGVIREQVRSQIWAIICESTDTKTKNVLTAGEVENIRYEIGLAVQTAITAYQEDKNRETPAPGARE